MNALETLKGARKVLEKPESWIQFETSRDAEGNWVEAADSNATCFCIFGAAQKVNGGDVSLNLHNITRPFMDGLTIGQWNDIEDRTHAEVIAKLDEIINALEKQNV